MGHGSGGRLTHDLIREIFMPPFDNPALRAGDDGAVVSSLVGNRLVLSTDSHVVWPLFFPGGDIGRLAVCGAVNDVAVMGAQPLYLTAGFILEEGLEVDLLLQVAISMQAAAREAGVQIVAGDTKVVERGKADGLFINTTGLGVLPTGVDINGANASAGDVVLISGTIGDHGIAVLNARGELGIESHLESDVAPLNQMIARMMDASKEIHTLRDPTRGGVATSLNEIALQSEVGILVEESSLPIHPEVNAACEILGFDPLYVANEGKIIAVVVKKDAEAVLRAMRTCPEGENAAVIGEIVTDHPGRVLMKTSIGTNRVVDMLMGEMLPRIC
jgi:hydrogenase expression/formation protein HypE